MFAVVFGLFGLIVGSFLNVVIMRRGVRSVGGRSSCMRCGATIEWYDLVPVASWIALRGRCRRCGSRISIQYPLVEATTGAMFALIGGSPSALFFFGPWYLGVSLIMAALLVCIAVYDLRHTIIPDAWVYSFDACALVAAFGAMMPIAPWWWATLWGPLAASPLFLLWFVSRGRWMGLGDAKLALGAGWLLGPSGIVAVFGAFVLGTFVLVPAMAFAHAVTHSAVWARRLPALTMKSEVPFGPFLVASMFLVWISGMYGIDIAHTFFPL